VEIRLRIDGKMASYLLDTNVLSEAVRPQPSKRVESFLSTESDLWLSVVALHEISYGVARVADPNRQIKLQTWIGSVKFRFVGRTIDVDGPIAEMAGRLRGYASSRGRVLEPLDSLVAATAAISSLVLATRNIRDFEYLNLNLHDPWAG
jgi:toxin FitB